MLYTVIQNLSVLITRLINVCLLIPETGPQWYPWSFRPRIRSRGCPRCWRTSSAQLPTSSRGWTDCLCLGPLLLCSIDSSCIRKVTCHNHSGLPFNCTGRRSVSRHPIRWTDDLCIPYSADSWDLTSYAQKNLRILVLCVLRNWIPCRSLVLGKRAPS